MSNMAKSLRCPPPDPDLTPSPPADLAAEVGSQLESLKWFLWHDNTFRTHQILDDLQIHLDTEDSGPEQSKLAKNLAEFAGYIQANTDRITHYGERRRCSETCARFHSCGHGTLSSTASSLESPRGFHDLPG